VGNNILGDLAGLSSISDITGDLEIRSNTMLSNLDDLQGLTRIISGGVSISDNASIENINGLANLNAIPESLTIHGNPGLLNIDGLARLDSIGDDVEIGYNDALTTIGMSSLEYIGGFFTIQQNPDLVSIQGLSNLNHIGQFSPSGMALTIAYNEALASLNGLQALDTIPGVTAIVGNASLINLDGLSSLKSVDGFSYNAGIEITGNASLENVSGLSGIEIITGGRASYLTISSNPVLTGIDLPNLQSIAGSLAADLTIEDNAALLNLDGLSSLTRVTAGLGVDVSISDNESLQNIDGLSSLNKVSTARNFTIANNTTLGRFCGLYTLFHSKGIGCGSPECYSTSAVHIEGNERNPTPGQIEEEGPCDATFSQPTNLVFSQVTSEGMHLRFNRGDGFISGYLALMKSFGPSAPEDVPQDGQTYHVGQVIGSSSIVVSVNSDTTFVVSGLSPSTPYYFDIFSWKVTENGNDYLVVNPLEGSQTTTSETPFVSTLSFTDITGESMTVMLNDPDTGNYIALMKAFGYPSPNDAPVDGTEYHIGNTVGSSTIVVNIGDGSAFTVNGLMPNVKYYFDIYRYDPSTFAYEANPSQGNQQTAQGGENLRAYPNPFDVATTIPFVVSQEEATVQVAIYDSMGKEVNVLATGNFGVGRHETSWDGYDKNGRRVNAGIYIYSVKSDKGVVTGRVSVR
jgi:hypothetical protein